MADQEARFALPAAARKDLEAAQTAYQRWLEAQDDFLLVDEMTAAAQTFVARLQAAVVVCLASGIDRQQLRITLTQRFAQASAEVSEIVRSVDASTAAVPQVSIEPKTVAAKPAVEQPEAAQWTRVCSACESVSTLSAEFCSKCGAALGEPTFADLMPLILGLRAEIDALRAARKQPGLPRTSLLSPDFLTRAFAVYGHAFVAGVIVALPLYLIVFLVGLVE